MFLQILVFVSLLLSSSPVVLSQQLSSTYQFNVTLVQDSYWLYWNFNTTTQSISFAVRVRTTGWIGFGLSPNGQMPGSDVVIGWIADDGTNYFHDRYAEGRFEPPIDPIQNWFLTSASVDNGYTTLEFYRNFTTCDDRDLNILFQTAHVVFSWNDRKPTINGPNSFTLLPHTTKASTVVNLLGGLPNPPSIPNNAETLLIATDQITIPSDETTYWCTAARLPADVRQSTKYVVKFAPNITAGSEQYVHHMLVYLCSGLLESDLGQGGSCDGVVSSRVSGCTSAGILIAAWAVGGSDFTYPSNVAYPIGGPSGEQFMVMETHYNNPNMVSGVIDSSGIAFTYISTRRQHNAGVLFLGHQVRPSMVIPPNAANFTVTGVCSGVCTRKLFPAGGIHIFANLLHTHLAGTGLSVRHLNQTTCSNGTRFQELKTVDRNLNYDFNFQQTTYLPEVITVLPGDTLTLECYYRTVGRSGVTLGGESTEEEMCLSFPVYYPKIENEYCVSRPNFGKFPDFVANYTPSQHHSALNGVNPNSRSSITTNLNLLQWTQEQIDAYQRLIYTEGEQISICQSAAHVGLTPSICCPYEEANTCTGFTPSPCCSRTCVGDREVPTTGASEVPTTGASTVYISVTLILTVVLMALMAILN